MKYCFLGLFFIIQVSFADTKSAENLDLSDIQFELVYEELNAPTISFDKLLADVDGLNRYVGSYPPRFFDKAERFSVYDRWKILLAEAVAYQKEKPNRMKTFYVLAELYRQGHNMDVRGAAAEADRLLQECFVKDALNVPCHLSASYFYLSIGEAYIGQAETSLDALRKHYGPYKNTEVERGYAFLYIYKSDIDGALAHIDRYFSAFGEDTPHNEFFKVMQKDLTKDRLITKVTIPIERLTEITSLDEFSRFTQNYYKEPKPELVKSAIEFLSSSDIAANPSAKAPILAAFTCVFSDGDKRQRKSWAKSIQKTKMPARGMLELALARSPQEMLNETPASPEKNDMNWACYFMTGDKVYLDNIVAVLDYIEDRKDMNLYLTAASAKWSLSSNAQTHKAVRDAMEILKVEGSDALKEHADHILIKSPRTMREQVASVLKAQREKGVW